MLNRSASLNERWQFHCDGSVISISATPNCSFIAAATVGRSLYLLDSDGQVVWKKGGSELDHEGWSTAISSDGSTIAVGTANKIPSNGTLYVYNTRGDLIFTKTLGAPVWSVSLSHDGQVLAATCWDGKAYRFKKHRSGYKQTHIHTEKTSKGLYGICLSESGHIAVLSAYDTALVILNEQWNEVARTECTAGLYNVDLAEDAGLAIAGLREGAFLLVNQSDRQSQSIKIRGCARPICGVAITRSGDIFICGSFDGWVYVVNRRGIPLGRMETNGEVWSVACSDDAALFCIASGDHTVRLIENQCSVAPVREISQLESAAMNGGADLEVKLDRLVRLYSRYGLHEYGYTVLRDCQEIATDTILLCKACAALLQEAIKVTDCNYWAHYELGLIAQEEKRHGEAIAHFQYAARNPTFTSRAMTRCAESFSSKQLMTATASCYRRARAQEIDAESKRVLYNLGRSYEDTKQWKEAISHLQLLSSWDIAYRNIWVRLENLLAVHGTTSQDSPPERTDYTGITISLLGPDSPREVDEILKGILEARTAEVLILPKERERISTIVHKLRANERFCRGITGTGLDYNQELFLKYDYALPEDETKKFLETVNLFYLLGDFKPSVTLDIGSATGRYPMLMKWLGANAYGIDIEPRAIKYAKRISKGDEWPHYEVADACKLPYKKGKFNLVTCMMGTFAHISLSEQQSVLCQIFKALKPGGYVAISTWDMECDHLAYLSIYNEKQKETIRKNSPSSNNMKQMLETAGFENVQLRPFCMLPQIVIYDLGTENLRSGDIQLVAQADLAVRALYPEKRGEMFLSFGKKPKI